jgi:excisionase family DNA binding protein
MTSMEQVPDGVALTSSEAAALLDVHTSTVKRWCNDGELESELTPGGHRRISIHAATTFARDRGIGTILVPFHPYEPHVWTVLRAITEDGSFKELTTLAMQWVRRGDFERLEQLLLTLGRIGSVPLSDFCDSALRDLLDSIGGEWERGRLRVGDEHMTTEVVIGVLHALRREWLDSQPDRSTATGGQSMSPPVAVVGTLEGNRHGIGALSTRMILERRGWRVYYPGVDVPVEDFGFVQMSRDASLVCISLPPNGTLGDVTRTLSILSKYYDQARPYSVVFGGLASVSLEGEIQEGPFESVAFFPTVGSLDVAISGGLGAADTRSRLTAVGAA